MKHRSLAHFVWGFFIFVRFATVLVLSPTWNGLFCSCVDDVSGCRYFFLQTPNRVWIIVRKRARCLLSLWRSTNYYFAFLLIILNSLNFEQKNLLNFDRANEVAEDNLTEICRSAITFGKKFDIWSFYVTHANPNLCSRKNGLCPSLQSEFNSQYKGGAWFIQTGGLRIARYLQHHRISLHTLHSNSS